MSFKAEKKAKAEKKKAKTETLVKAKEAKQARKKATQAMDAKKARKTEAKQEEEAKLKQDSRAAAAFERGYKRGKAFVVEEAYKKGRTDILEMAKSMVAAYNRQPPAQLTVAPPDACVNQGPTTM